MFGPGFNASWAIREGGEEEQGEEEEEEEEEEEKATREGRHGRRKPKPMSRRPGPSKKEPFLCASSVWGNTCAVGGGRAAFLERLTKRRVATYYTCSTSHTLECGTRGAPVATSSSAAMGGRQLRVPLLATSSAAMGGRQFFNDARASTGLLASLETML